MTSFYNKFIELCEAKGVFPTNVARAIGIGTPNVTYWKNGSLPKVGTVKKLASYFDVPVSVFFEEGTMEHVEQMLNDIDPQKRDLNKAKIDILQEELENQPLTAVINAIDAADEATILAFKDISDQYIKKLILEEFETLNRRGKIEVLLIVQSLSEDGRFHR